VVLTSQWDPHRCDDAGFEATFNNHGRENDVMLWPRAIGK